MAAKRENGLPYQWLAALAIFCILLYLLRDILAPFLTAAIIAYICSPLVDRLMRLHMGKLRMGRTLATSLVLLLLSGIFVLLLLIVVPLLQKEILLLAQRLPAYFQALRSCCNISASRSRSISPRYRRYSRNTGKPPAISRGRRCASSAPTAWRFSAG